MNFTGQVNRLEVIQRIGRTEAICYCNDTLNVPLRAICGLRSLDTLQNMYLPCLDNTYDYFTHG